MARTARFFDLDHRKHSVRLNADQRLKAKNAMTARGKLSCKIVGGAALLFFTCASAYANTALLPPTYAGSATACPPASNSLLAMTDVGSPGNGSAINCVAGTTLDRLGNLTSNGNANFDGKGYFGGSVGIGVPLPQATLDVAGEVKIGNSGAACSSANTGAVRFNVNSAVNPPVKSFQGCDGTKWVSLTTLVPTEQIICNGYGTGGSGVASSNCGSASVDPFVEDPALGPPPGYVTTFTHTSAAAHDYCSIKRIEGWRAGFLGSCDLTGNPGTTWTLTVSIYSSTNPNQSRGTNQAECDVQCYDFGIQ